MISRVLAITMAPRRLMPFSGHSLVLLKPSSALLGVTIAFSSLNHGFSSHVPGRECYSQFVKIGVLSLHHNETASWWTIIHADSDCNNPRDGLASVLIRIKTDPKAFRLCFATVMIS